MLSHAAHAVRAAYAQSDELLVGSRSAHGWQHVDVRRGPRSVGIAAPAIEQSKRGKEGCGLLIRGS